MELASAQVFNDYIITTLKAAACYNRSKRKYMSNRRRSYWIHQYFRYAKRAIRLALRMPLEQRFHFERFVIYNRTKNRDAFKGTIQEARKL